MMVDVIHNPIKYCYECNMKLSETNFVLIDLLITSKPRFALRPLYILTTIYLQQSEFEILNKAESMITFTVKVILYCNILAKGSPGAVVLLRLCIYFGLCVKMFNFIKFFYLTFING